MKLAIAEDSAILRLTLAELLEGRGHRVVIQASSATELLSALNAYDAESTADEATVDVVIMDVRMPPTFTNEGIIAALELRAQRPDIGVLVFSQYVETSYAAQLFAGHPSGVGYLLKDRVAEVSQFVVALERIHAGETVLDPEVVAKLIGASSSRNSIDSLTPREREVLELMAQGRSNTAISEHLHVSSGTVEKYVSGIFAKLDLPPAPQDHRRVLAVLKYLGI